MHKKPACIIRPHNAGLWSLINNVATCGELYENVFVDWHPNDQLLYKHPSNDPLVADRSNLWFHLFAGTDLQTCANFHQHFATADVLPDYPDQHLTYLHVAKHYTDPDQSWREVYHKHWDSWRVRGEFVQQAFDWVEKVAFGFEPFIAVLVRAHPHAGEQTSGKSQALDDYGHAVRSMREQIADVYQCRQKDVPVFVMAGDWPTVGYFQHHFDAAFYPGLERTNNRDLDPHRTRPQTYRDAELALIEVMILAQAHTLIHPVSNMATGALYINPALRSVYIP